MAIQDLLTPGSRLGSLPAAPSIPIQPIVPPGALQRSMAETQATFQPEVLGQRFLGGMQIEAQRQGNQLRLNTLSMLPAGSNELDVQALQEYQASIGGTIPIREDGKADIDKIRETLGARKALEFIGVSGGKRAVGGMLGGNELPTGNRQKMVEEMLNAGVPVSDPATGLLYDDATLLEAYQSPDNFERIQAVKPVSEAQANSRIFGQRMEFNNGVLDNLAKQGFDPSGLTLKNLVNKWGPNPLKSPQYQVFQTTGRNWVAALLRRESGAAITEEEYRQGQEQYLPKIGDVPATLETKTQLRRMAEQLFKNASGDPNLYRDVAENPLVNPDFTVDELGNIVVPAGSTLTDTGQGYFRVASPLGNVQYVPVGLSIVDENGVKVNRSAAVRSAVPQRSPAQFAAADTQPPVVSGVPNSALLSATLQDSPRGGKYRAVLQDGSIVPLTKPQIDALRGMRQGAAAVPAPAPMRSPASAPIDGAAGIFG